MRLVLALVLFAACGASTTPAPAWPKTADRETDGGESLAPRQATTVAAAEDEPAAAAPVTVEAAPAATSTATPTAVTPTTTPTITAPEDTITVEEIVIEIEVE